MHVRIQGIRTGRQLGRARTHDVMTSSSLGRCASGAQRGGNIASLFLSVRANVDAVGSVEAAHSIIGGTPLHVFPATLNLIQTGTQKPTLIISHTDTHSLVFLSLWGLCLT